MEYLSYKQLEIVEDLLQQIKGAILDVQKWNENVANADDWHSSPDGMKTLAASCMLIEAIGEGYQSADGRRCGTVVCQPVQQPQNHWYGGTIAV